MSSQDDKYDPLEWYKDEATGIWHLRDISPTQKEHKRRESPMCTCGVKFVTHGGKHSEWCLAYSPIIDGD